jgi:hypothetical protein
MHHLPDSLSDPSTLQRVAVPLGYMHIVTADPLLGEYREECHRKTEGKACETKRSYMDHDVECGWAKKRVRGRRRRIDRNLWGDGSELLRELRKEGGLLFEVIHLFVCGFDFQVIDPNDVTIREAIYEPAYIAYASAWLCPLGTDKIWTDE